jgi:hypothetical protein
MKKIFLYGLMFCATAFGFTSCNDDNDQLTDTRVTNYILLTVNGDEVVYVDANSTYTDEGCTAEAGGQDVTSKVQTTNPVDTKNIGPYIVSYRATNEDGFSSEAYRYVYVGSPLVGTVADGSYRQTYNGDGSPKAQVAWSGFNIEMLTDGNGLYWVEDLMGGYYEQRAGYGSRYAMNGYLQVNADNTVEMVGGGGVPGWGDAYDDFANGVFDPATNTISYCLTYAGMDFNVILNLN